MIDDSPVFLELMREILENEGGYEVTTLDRSEGVVVREDAAPPDLIVLDVALHNGPTGMELAERLMNSPATESIPILLCTALREREIDRIASALAVSRTFRVLYKPFDIEVVLQHVEELLDLRAPERCVVRD